MWKNYLWSNLMWWLKVINIWLTNSCKLRKTLVAKQALTSLKTSQNNLYLDWTFHKPKTMRDFFFSKNNSGMIHLVRKRKRPPSKTAPWREVGFTGPKNSTEQFVRPSPDDESTSCLFSFACSTVWRTGESKKINKGCYRQVKTIGISQWQESRKPT